MSTHISHQKSAKKLSQCIDYYEVCNRAEGKSPRTVIWYSANLRLLRNYLKSRHLPDSIDNIDTKLLREYVIYLLKRNRFDGHRYTPVQVEPLSSATAHGHVRTLRDVFSWLAMEGLTQDNAAKDLKPPKVTRKVVTTLPDQEIESLLNTLSSATPSEARNRTIFMILLDTGLRIGELINLSMEDTHMDEGFLKVTGKGKKERIVPIGNNAQRALQRYLFRYRSNPTLPRIDNVFLSIHGDPLTENSIKLMFARVAQRSGVQRLHAHLCRHTFATRFLINGGIDHSVHM